jgi:glutamyl-tRNA reductase
LHDQTERIRRHELNRALRLLSKGDDPEKVLEQLSRGLSNKFLHLPIQTLQQASNEEREALLNLLRRLYQIHSPE